MKSGLKLIKTTYCDTFISADPSNLSLVLFTLKDLIDIEILSKKFINQ